MNLFKHPKRKFNNVTLSFQRIQELVHSMCELGDSNLRRKHHGSALQVHLHVNDQFQTKANTSTNIF